MKLASKIQSEISAWSASKGYVYNKIMVASKNGIPDVVIVAESMALFFEVKTKTDALSALQIYTINRMNKKEEIAFVVESLDEVQAIIAYKLKK